MREYGSIAIEEQVAKQLHAVYGFYLSSSLYVCVCMRLVLCYFHFYLYNSQPLSETEGRPIVVMETT